MNISWLDVDRPLAFIDLETTGATAAIDRITEVGIVEVNGDGIKEWSSLVNPLIPIPAFIVGLTGISNDMVKNAPTFATLAEEIYQRLDGRLFIAHNARFDHGFLKNEFKRLGISFRPTVLCTVKLSRKLYPGFSRHNLDSLIERHRLVVTERHRALGDARLLWQFWQKIHASESHSTIKALVKQLTARPTLPPHLDQSLIDELPNGHGVYRFLGVTGQVLYIGKANDLRRRILAHFASDHRDTREMEMCQQVTQIDWSPCAGELGALLLEAQMIKHQAPIYNQLLRQETSLCSWRIMMHSDGLRVALASTDDLFFDQDEELYGLYSSSRKAQHALRHLADAFALCPVLLGLDKAAPGKPCFSSQVRRCLGACHGLEPRASHDQRVLDALATWRLQTWPYRGPIRIREGDSWHVIDGWAYFGSTRSKSDCQVLLQRGRGNFDRHVYRLLAGRMAGLSHRIETISDEPVGQYAGVMTP